MQKIGDFGREVEGNNEEFEYRDKSLGSTKVSTIGGRRDRGEGDSFLDSCSSKFGESKKLKSGSGKGK